GGFRSKYVSTFVLPDDLARKINASRHAVHRGKEWLATQIKCATPFGNHDADLNWLAKTPWALSVTDRRTTALRALELARRRIDNTEVLQKTDWTNALPYALGWLVAGARSCECFGQARFFYTALQ